jgi:hypothetical protein
MTRPDFSHASEEMAKYVIPGKVKVVIGWIGEGRYGDFDEEDTGDTPYLRLSAYDLERITNSRSKQDNSYCTLLPAWTPVDVLQSVCHAIANSIVDEDHWKRRLEEWSWVDWREAYHIHWSIKQGNKQ